MKTPLKHAFLISFAAVSAGRQDSLGNLGYSSASPDLTPEDLEDIRSKAHDLFPPVPSVRVVILGITRLNPTLDTPNEWADAVANLCVINHCGFDINDPDKTLHGLIDIEVQMALDPAINEFDRRWQPIPEHDADYPIGDLLLYCPDLVSEDFNPSGTVEAFWQPGPWMDGDLPDHVGNWLGAVWNNEQDCYDTKAVKPTHYMLKPRPPRP